ncbi:MAG: polysaccharide pyruvyl transferase family protein [bacterium]|nr:polysaccharide pyruvyl transferase family protein [bacterium]
MKIVVCGNYGAGNLGDEMILGGLLETLKSIDPNAEITVLSGKPSETSKIHKVKSVEKFPAGIRSFFTNTSKTKEALKECDYFILGGGGLFGSLTFNANFIWGMQAFRAYLYKKPVLMLGQSIGKLKGLTRKLIVKRIFKKSELIVVRDPESKSRLRSLGIKKNISVAPDFAFCSKAKVLDTTEKKAVIALRQMDYISLLFKKQIANFLDELVEFGWKVKLVDFQKGELQDSKLNEDVISMMVRPQKVKHIKSQNKILEEFSRANFVLGMRLHSIIGAIKNETPFIAINYAPKVEAFLNYTELSQYLVNMEEADSDDMMKMFKGIIKNRDSYKTKMKQFNKKAEKAHVEIRKIIKKVMS